MFSLLPLGVTTMLITYTLSVSNKDWLERNRTRLPLKPLIRSILTLIHLKSIMGRVKSALSCVEMP